jgi:hypothetical protein
MAGKNTSVLGIYSNYAAVERAVDELRDAGFRNTDISVLFPANAGTKDFAHEKGLGAQALRLVAPSHTGGALGWLAGSARWFRAARSRGRSLAAPAGGAVAVRLAALRVR